MVSQDKSKVQDCVLYLYIQEPCTQAWCDNVVQLLAGHANLPIILIASETQANQFRVQAQPIATQLKPERMDWTEQELYQFLFKHHQQLTPEADLLLLYSGVFLPQQALTHFSSALNSNPHIATVSPLCNQGQLFALFDNAPEDVPLELINRALAETKSAAALEFPFFYPLCVYWRKDAMAALLGLGLEDISTIGLAKSITNAGFIHSVSPWVYANAALKQSNAVASIDNHMLSQPLLLHHPLQSLRLQLKQFYQHYQTARQQAKNGPVQLHIMHSWGGGLHLWVRDYIDADQQGQNFVLKSLGDWGAFGKLLALYRHPDATEPIKQWRLHYPIHGTAITHMQYTQIIAEIIEDFAIEQILVSSLIGHALDCMNTTIPTAIVLHDFYPFCPAIYIYHDGICQTCDSNKLQHCEQHNPLNNLFKGVDHRYWLGVRKRYAALLLAQRHPLIVPSESVARHFKQLLPELQQLPFQHIPHGLPDKLARVKKLQPNAHPRLRIILLGKLDTHKGLGLFRQIASEITTFADVILLGSGKSGKAFKNIKGIRVETHYEQDQLTARLRHYAPDLGLLLPIWPETYSYTLSELLAHAIPTVVTANGALLDRIEDGHNGFVVDSDPESIIAQLRLLAENRDAIVPVKNQLLQLQCRTAAMMVNDYQQLFSLKNSNSSAADNKREWPVHSIMGTVLSRQSHQQEDFFITMRQLQLQLLAMVNKSPDISKSTRRIFTVGIKCWIYFPVRLASWYVHRRTRK